MSTMSEDNSWGRIDKNVGMGGTMREMISFLVKTEDVIWVEGEGNKM